VLRTQELGDADLIVSLLAEHCGKVRGVARSARRSRKRFGGVLEPLTHVRAVWVTREGRELSRIDSLDCLRSFAEMQADPERQAACAVLSEVSEVFAREGEADTKSFKLLGSVLEALEGGLGAWVTVRYFEYWTLRLHGLLPDLGHCAGCGVELDPRRVQRVAAGAGIRCGSCSSGGPEGLPGLGQAEREFLELTRRLPPAKVTAAPGILGSGSALDRLLRGTLESFAERSFRTYKHLRAATVAEADRGLSR